MKCEGKLSSESDHRPSFWRDKQSGTFLPVTRETHYDQSRIPTVNKTMSQHDSGTCSPARAYVEEDGAGAGALLAGVDARLRAVQQQQAVRRRRHLLRRQHLRAPPQHLVKHAPCDRVVPVTQGRMSGCRKDALDAADGQQEKQLQNGVKLMNAAAFNGDFINRVSRNTSGRVWATRDMPTWQLG